MHLRLHANAVTTPRTRAYIQQSLAPVAELSAELGISETTVRRWRGRITTEDRSHRPKRMSISLTPLEEELVLELRAKLELPLDDLVEVMRRCVNPKLSRSAIHRCLQRHGISKAERPVPDKPGCFAEYPFGFVHIDLKHLPSLIRRKSYVFVAIERATRFVYVEIIMHRDASTVATCLKRFLKAFGHPVHTILTDNGSEFTDRFAVDMKGKPEGKPSGNHPFDRACAEHGIEHRLTKPFHPQTNGMVERFNRRIAEAFRGQQPAQRNADKNKFNSHEERNAFIHTFVHDYNRTRLRCLNYIAPSQALTN